MPKRIEFDGVVVKQIVQEGGTFKGAAAGSLADAIFGIES
mgnify:CR=1 FL=1